MVFNSFEFIIFMMAVFFLYYILPGKHRWKFLLIASYVFYAIWNPILLLLLLLSNFFNYIMAINIEKFAEQKNCKRLLIFAISINFINLLFFKYIPFFEQIKEILYNFIGFNYVVPSFNVILPMGISFYTFQSVGYLVDVYRKDFKAEKNFFKLSLFITFFPQLVAGPIERVTALMPQLFKVKKFKVENLIIGSKFMIVGFFKKIVIADRISVAVNTVFNSPGNYQGLPVLIASVLFSFQIYCDFSGYSDIALGCSKILGIDLMENFRQPFFSKSIKEFWRRWHISLSGWFKDYLYFPLGGSRCSHFRNYFNLMLTFLASGLWHGANLTFILWGFLHAMFQIIGNISRKPKEMILTTLHLQNFFLIRIFRTLTTFFLVTFAFIFFRANNILDGIYLAKQAILGVFDFQNFVYVYNTISNMGLGIFEFLVAIFCIVVLLIIEFFCKEESVCKATNNLPILLRFLFYLFLSFLIISLGVFYSGAEFIYFQF